MTVRDLDRFYELLAELEERLGGRRILGECHGRMSWAKRGVYFFFEPCEYRRCDPTVPRVVRVGTHAVSMGSGTTLWQRLSQHRGVQRTGLGNHRGSVFRKLVGEALRARYYEPGDFPEWGIASSAPRETREKEKPLELEVSRYLGAMPLLWVGVDDEAGPSSDRAMIERNAIALISNHGDPQEPPTDGWLGLHSTRDAVRLSGLWNVHHVFKDYDPSFLDLFGKYVSATEA